MSRRIGVEYMLIQGEQQDFQAAVTGALKAGWSCQGGVAFIERPGEIPHVWFAQAMIYETFVCDGPGDDG